MGGISSFNGRHKRLEQNQLTRGWDSVFSKIKQQEHSVLGAASSGGLGEMRRQVTWRAAAAQHHCAPRMAPHTFTCSPHHPIPCPQDPMPRCLCAHLLCTFRWQAIVWMSKQG